MVFNVGEIVVQATRPVTTTGGAAAVEVRIDSVRLKAAPTLEQLMRTLPLVQVRTNSRGEAQFSLRGSGSDARQVAVLVDGIPLSLGWDDRADLSIIPVTAAHTLTLARGLPSLLYGPNVLGGVVEIGVARGATAELNPRGARLDAGVDHVGARGVSASVTLPIDLKTGDLLVRAGAGHRDRDGVVLPGDVVEPVPGDDHDLRVNTDLRHNDAFAALRFESHAGAWAAFTAAGFDAARGIPAELHLANARYWRYPELRRGLAVISGGTGARPSPLGGRGDVELSIGLDAAHTEIDQFTSRSYQQIEAEEDSDDRNLTLRVRADQTLGARAELRTAFTYADVNHDEVLTPGTSASYRQRLWSAGSELALKGVLPAGRISLGAAYDWADTPESGDKPSLGELHEWGARAGFTTSVSDRALLHGGISRRARFPALRELYSGALGRFEPNPDLTPETLVAAEAGVTLRVGRGEVQAVAFRHALSDAIVRVSTPARKFKRVNRDNQTGTGLELIVSAALGRIGLGADATLQHTTLEADDGSASEPEYQPDVLAGASLTAALPFELRLDTRARYVGRQSCVNPETDALDTIDAATTVDAEIGRTFRVRAGWASRFDTTLAIDNIGDTATYDQCGLPQAGRTLRLQIRLR